MSRSCEFIHALHAYAFVLAYLVSLFEDTNLAAIHAKRVTMYVQCLMKLHSVPDVTLPLLANPRTLPSPVVSVASALKHELVR